MIELAKIAKACSEDKFSHGHCINTIQIAYDPEIFTVHVE